MRVTLTSDAFTEVSVTQGTLQNLSPQAAIEIVTEETENSGIVLYPRQKLTFSHATTVYARAVWDTVTDGETVILAVEPIFNQAGGGSDVKEWQLWSDFEVNHVYAAGDVFRTEDTPSWGYWQVTTGGTSDETIPSGTTEGDTATSGTMVVTLTRIGSGGGSVYDDIARAWAMGAQTPDGETDADSPTGYTQSSKTWAETSKAWAVDSNSPDGETDTDSPTGYTQSSKTWAERAKYYGVAAEQFAAQTETQVNPSAWSAATTYNFPDVVAYTDGYTYRCVGSNIVGDVPGLSMNWVCLSRVTSAAWEYDTNGGIMPVINPVGDSDWELDSNGALMPTA